MNVKYIIIDECFPVLFSYGITHSDVNIFPRFGNGKITSAGFCSINSCNDFEDGKRTVNVTVWGESVSLGIKSKPQDAEIIRKMKN